MNEKKDESELVARSSSNYGENTSHRQSML